MNFCYSIFLYIVHHKKIINLDANTSNGWRALSRPDEAPLLTSVFLPVDISSRARRLGLARFRLKTQVAIGHVISIIWTGSKRLKRCYVNLSKPNGSSVWELPASPRLSPPALRAPWTHPDLLLPLPELSWRVVSCAKGSIQHNSMNTTLP